MLTLRSNLETAGRVVRRWALVAAAAVSFWPVTASAFWVVNFGPADALAPRRIGFAAGLGGQVVIVGQPSRVNGFFIIPHAGIRFGLLDRVDLGLRLAPIPLPYSSVGPGFGANLDVKVRLSEAGSKVGLALIAGLGGAHVLLQDVNRAAWSPNAAALLSFLVGEKTQLTAMARYVYLAIPTAAGGSGANFLHVAGASLGLKLVIAEHISLLPEIGSYWYEGAIGGVRMSGPGFQYGIMLATSF